MLDSYFFIPGDKSRFLSKIQSLKSDYFVIDLEDAVSTEYKAKAYQNIIHRKFESNTYLRAPFFDGTFSNAQLSHLIEHFEGRLVIPKVKSSKDLNFIHSLYSSNLKVKAIILVENPYCLVHIKEILDEHNNSIHGIGFGSHDFCAYMGMEHTTNNLHHYRQELILHAKAYDKVYVDTVDTNLNDFSNFRSECIHGFKMGIDGKFLIHPLQLEELRKVQYMDDNELEKLKSVYEHLRKLNIDEIDVLKIDGEIYEKPHFMRIEKLINKLNRK